MTGEVQAADYVALLEAVKGEIAASRVRAARAVNAELISMYWRIGALILERQAAQGWGARVVERLAADLRASFPGARGLSRRNLHYMRAFAEAWHEEVPQPVAQLPWGHVRVLLDRLEDHEVRQWYAARDAAEGWSRAVLETMVASRLHLRQGVAPSNFPATLPGADSDVAQEMTRDPYVFDFVRLQPGYRWWSGTVSSSRICCAITPACTGMWSSSSSLAGSTLAIWGSCSSMCRPWTSRSATS